ncbi:hypothetical protein D3C81_1902350 [compost metagenome]
MRVMLRIPFFIRRQAKDQGGDETGKNGEWEAQDMHPGPYVFLAVQIEAMQADTAK